MDGMSTGKLGDHHEQYIYLGFCLDIMTSLELSADTDNNLRAYINTTFESFALIYPQPLFTTAAPLPRAQYSNPRYLRTLTTCVSL